MKKILVFLFLIGFLFSSGLSLTNFELSDDYSEPGSSGVLTLTISNTNTGSAITDNLVGVKLSIYPPSAIIIDDEVFIGDLDASTSSTISIPFKVKTNVTNQIYVLEVRANAFSESTSSSPSKSFFVSSYIPISVVKAPLFSLSSQEDIISGVQKLTLTLRNNGGPAKDLRITVPSDHFALSGSDEIFIDEIVNSVSFDVILDSRSASEGPNDVNFSITYQDALGKTQTEQRTLRLSVKKEKLNLDISQKDPLITRQEGDLNLLIINNGNKIYDVRLFVNDANLKLKQINEIQLGDLDEKEQKEISLKVVPELSPGVNDVQMSVNWFEGEVEKTQVISVPVKILSDADVGIYLEAKPTPLMVGQEHTLSILVSNIGSYPIDNVEVSFSSDSLELLDIQNKEYIGSLNQDDFSTVQFKVKVKDVEPGSHNLTMNVRYRDNSGEWSSKEIQAEILINPAQIKEEGPFLYLALIIVMALIVWYFRFRKK
ncbi:MAG TPA: hypothetical protein VI912_04120 [Candidatus Bilamarchaeaceae archaeon]|nr:hypothetical protein [Candidatus Bilamarchaeaceae archaeon]